MTEDREWVRNQRVAGFVAGRFTGEYEGAQRELVALQTIGQGLIVVPAAALLPVDRAYMIRQAGLDLERIIGAMLEGGLSLEDAQAAWYAAMAHIQAVAGRQETVSPSSDR